MYPETTYEITTLTPQQPTAHPAMLHHEIPPGVQMVTLPGGIRTLAYTPQQTPPAQPAPVAQPIPAWAKTTALLTPAIGVGIAGAGIGISYAAPGLIAMSQALWAAVALIAAAAIGAPLLLRAGRTRTGSTQITQNITASGMFGKANGTINHH